MGNSRNLLPEITVKAVFLGIGLSIILAAANAYLGLFAGITVSASIPAAVISMGILRFFRNSNILENNIVQTAASAGESLAAGVIFTIPALVIMDYWDAFNFKWVTIIAGFGGLLGVLFTIPLRRSLIIDSKLKFPEGIATAEVLESGRRGGSDILIIIKSAIASGLFKLGSGSGLRLLPDATEIAHRVGGSVAYLGTNLSPALLAVGYIVGLNIAVLIIIGGAINWIIAVPICAALQDWPLADDGSAMAAVDVAWTIWSTKTRYLGVGGMVVGGLWTIFKLRGSLVGGIKSGFLAYKKTGKEAATLEKHERDIPMKWVVILLVASIIPLFLVYNYFVGDVSVTLPMAVVMLVTGFLFSAVAGYMAGLVGSSNNPISGVTIATVTISAFLLLLLMGHGAENGPPAAIVIGAVVCCAAAIAGDNMQDLKAGHIVGATPWKQQVMQIVGTMSAALVMAPVLTLLYKGYGFAGHSSGIGNPNALIAAQSNLMASVSKGVFSGDLPWLFIGIGAIMAVAFILIDEFQIMRGSSFRTPVLAVTIGVYLPLELEIPIFIGGIIHFLIKGYQKRHALAAKQVETSDRHGLLFASGLITGEALIGILLAVPIVLFKQDDVLAIIKNPTAITEHISTAAGLALLLLVSFWLYVIGRGKTARD